MPTMKIGTGKRVRYTVNYKKSKKKAMNAAIKRAVTRGVTSYSTIRARSLIPSKSVLRFPYTALITQNTPDATISEDFRANLFVINDIFDPSVAIVGDNNITATGFQHVFGTPANNYKDGIYQQFCVLKCDITVDFVNDAGPNGAPVIVATYLNSVNNADLNYRTMTNQPIYYQERVLGNEASGRGITTLRRKFDAARFSGDDVRDIEKEKGAFNASPTNRVYLYVMSRSMNNSPSQTVQLRVKLNYTVECTVNRDLEQGDD